MLQRKKQNPPVKFKDASDLTNVYNLRERLLSENLIKPVVFNGFINHWGARSWSPQSLAESDLLVNKALYCRVVGFEDGSEMECGEETDGRSGMCNNIQL